MQNSVHFPIFTNFKVCTTFPPANAVATSAPLLRISFGLLFPCSWRNNKCGASTFTLAVVGKIAQTSRVQ